MDSLADAVVYLFAYLNVAGEPIEGAARAYDRDDNDCKALESVVNILESATSAELDALKAATQRAIARDDAPAWAACYDDLLAHLAGQEHLSDST